MITALGLVGGTAITLGWPVLIGFMSVISFVTWIYLVFVDEVLIPQRAHKIAVAESAQTTLEPIVATVFEHNTLTTTITVGNSLFILDMMTVDPHDDDSVATAARVRIRNEEAIPGIANWLNNPHQLSPATEFVDGIDTIPSQPMAEPINRTQDILDVLNADVPSQLAR